MTKYKTPRDEGPASWGMTEAVHSLSFQTLLQHLPVAVGHASEEGHVTFLNRKFVEILGYTQEDIPDLSQWWLKAYPDESLRQQVLARWSKVLALTEQNNTPLKPGVYPVTRKDGTLRQIQIRVIRIEGGVLTTFEDMTESLSQRGQLEMGNLILHQLTQGQPLRDVLASICLQIEARVPGICCSVLLLEDGVRVRQGAAPSLPDAFNQQVDGQPIGPLAGSCGTAAYTRSEVFAADISVDASWASYRPLAQAHGLAACWSSPIFSTQQQVLGTFAIYWKTPQRAVSDTLRQLVSVGTSLAAISIETHQRQEQLCNALDGLARAEEVGKMGSWQWDLRSGKVQLSRQLQRIVGLQADQPLPNMAQWWGWIHPEDRPLLEGVVRDMMARKSQTSPWTAPVFRRHPGLGPVMHLQASLSEVKEARGEILAYLGTLTDVTGMVEVQSRIRSQLQELQSWQQVMLQREDRVLELKREVNQLLTRLGLPVRYTSVNT